MKIIKIQQNSEDWLEYRKGKSGGSEFKNLYITGLPLISAMKAKLDELQIEYKKTAKAGELASLLTPEAIVELKLTAEPKKHYYELIADRVARPITPNDYAGQLNGQPFSMMARGHILEPEALALFNETYRTNFQGGDVVWEREDNPNIYISPDGYLEKDGKITEAIEIKCLDNAETIKAYLTNSYPKDYEPQIIKYFVVNEDLEKLHFVMYTDTIPGLELQVFEITRKQIAPRIAEAKAFEDQIMRMVECDAQKIAELGF